MQKSLPQTDLCLMKVSADLQELFKKRALLNGHPWLQGLNDRPEIRCGLTGLTDFLLAWPQSRRQSRLGSELSHLSVKLIQLSLSRLACLPSCC